jgi:hypothetical protein
MFKKNLTSRVLLVCFVCLMTAFVLVTASSPQARSWNGNHPDDITNEGWSYPEVQDSDDEVSLVQTMDGITNEGWVEPAIDDSTRDALPAQDIDNVINESRSYPEIQDSDDEVPPVQPVDDITNEGWVEPVIDESTRDALPAQDIENITNEGWSYPEVQDSDDEAPAVQTMDDITDDITNEGWVEPVIDKSTRDALPAQQGDSVTNEGLSTAHRQEQVKDALAFTDYTNASSFETAAGGNLATITFTEVPVGTVVTDHYLGLHAQFTDADDVTLVNASSYPTDNIGVNGNGRVHLRLTEPAIAIGSDYPGALTIELWDRQGGTLLYTSSSFGGSGAGFFGGVVSTTPFTFVVLRDWVDDLVYLDNIYIKDVETAGDYRDLPSFDAAAGGNLATITFTEVQVGTVVTDHYLDLHAQFTDADDVTLVSASGFPTDDIGVNGSGRVHLRLTEPAIAIGSDYPGALTIELWDRQGGTLLYTSSSFGGSGAGFFGGVVSTTPFTFVVLRDWVDDLVYLDNIYIKDVETAGDYRDLPSFVAATDGYLATIKFTEVPVGTVVTDHYLGRHAHAQFTDANDVTLVSASGFPTDDIGVNGSGRVHLRLTEPAIAIGSDYPGALTIELWDQQGGTLLYTSSSFGGSGTGFFGGVVSTTPFSFVVLRDWVDDFVYLDNIHIIRDDFSAYLPIVLSKYPAGS